MPQFDTHFFSSLIFWEVVSFAVLLWVLWKFAFPPILETLEARERKIRESLEQAERHRAEAEHKLQEYEAKLAAASKDAEALLAAARERAQRVLEENEQRLQTEAERIKGDAQREIDHERRKAIQEIRNQTTDLALLVAEKVVGRSLSDADHRRLADEALQAVAENSSYKKS
jgi:F-type H+-transporting ATPase subunit b